MPDEVERQRRVKTAILERVQDLTAEENLAYALIEAGFDLLAAGHRPARLSAAERAAVRDNYPDATPELIAARSVDEAGLVNVVSAAETYARIYLDYSPLSHWKPDLRRDRTLDGGMSEEAAGLVAATYRRWRAAGVSSFGVCCVLVLHSVQHALRCGLGWPKVVRILLDATQICYRGRAGTGPGLSEAETVQTLIQMLGLSKPEAKRYMAMAKAMPQA